MHSSPKSHRAPQNKYGGHQNQHSDVTAQCTGPALHCCHHALHRASTTALLPSTTQSPAAHKCNDGALHESQQCMGWCWCTASCLQCPDVTALHKASTTVLHHALHRAQMRLRCTVLCQECPDVTAHCTRPAPQHRTTHCTGPSTTQTLMVVHCTIPSSAWGGAEALHGASVAQMSLSIAQGQHHSTATMYCTWPSTAQTR